MCSRRLVTELEETGRRGKLGTDLSGTKQNIVVSQRFTSCYFDQLPEEKPGLLLGNVRVLKRQKTTRIANTEPFASAARRHEDAANMLHCGLFPLM